MLLSSRSFSGSAGDKSPLATGLFRLTADVPSAAGYSGRRMHKLDHWGLPVIAGFRWLDVPPRVALAIYEIPVPSSTEKFYLPRSNSTKPRMPMSTRRTKRLGRSSHCRSGADEEKETPNAAMMKITQNTIWRVMVERVSDVAGKNCVGAWDKKALAPTQKTGQRGITEISWSGQEKIQPGCPTFSSRFHRASSAPFPPRRGSVRIGA